MKSIENKNDIEIKKLFIAYEKRLIIENMNLSIPEGKITMIIGSNGCGKSTLLKTMASIIKPKKGGIWIKGKNILDIKRKEAAKHIAVLPQSPQTPPGLLVKELVAYGRFPHQKAMGGMSSEDIKVVEWAMKETEVFELANRPLENLSGGQRQRAWIAMALAQETEILLLDEPTTYLDMSHQLEILQLLERLNKEKGRTIVIVLHELNHACRFASHIIGMKAGKVVFEGIPKDVITEENLFKIYGIHAQLSHHKTKNYPICLEYDF